MILPSIDPQLKRTLALPAPDQIGFAVKSIEKSIKVYSYLFGWGLLRCSNPNIWNRFIVGDPEISDIASHMLKSVRRFM
jgi:hypothetical protein